MYTTVAKERQKGQGKQKLLPQIEPNQSRKSTKDRGFACKQIGPR